MKEVITSCRAAFEHLNVTIEDMVAEGDRVAARFGIKWNYYSEIESFTSFYHRILLCCNWFGIIHVWYEICI